MDEIEVTVKRSVFPISGFELKIHKHLFNLKSGRTKNIVLPKQDQYEIVTRSYWLEKRMNIFLRNNSTINVKHIIPDLYYIIGTSLVVLLSVLTFFGLVSAGLLSGVILLYMLPLMYYTFLKRSKYFKIIVDNSE